MREITFRGKRKDNGEWVEGFFSQSPSGTHYITRTSGTGCAEPVKVDPATVGQYTGLEDANDRRIFEGDRIEGLFLHGRPITGTVEFMEGAFGVEWMRGNIQMFTPFTSTCNVKWEVVAE